MYSKYNTNFTCRAVFLVVSKQLIDNKNFRVARGMSSTCGRYNWKEARGHWSRAYDPKCP